MPQSIDNGALTQPSPLKGALMKRLYRFDTAKGPVFIAKAPTGQFLIEWNREYSGNYGSAHLAAGDASVGSHFSFSDGTDLGALGISDSLRDWTISAPGGPIL